MTNQKHYSVEFSTEEINSLLECLAELRKSIVNSSYGTGRRANESPIFVVASKLQYKLAYDMNPDSNVTLEEYLNYGN